MKTTKKCNFFKRIVYSFIPSKYGTLVYAGSAFLFMFTLSLVLTVLTVTKMFVEINQSLQESFGVGSCSELVEKYVPDFSIKNGNLDMKEKVNYTVDKVCIYFDSTVEEITMSDMDYLVNQSGFEVILMGSKTNTFTYNGQSGEIQMYKYSQLFYQDVDKQDLVEVVKQWTSAKTVIPLLTGLVGIYDLVQYALKALLLGVLISIVNLFLHKNIRFSKAYAMSVYALVPWMLLEQLVMWLPFTIPTEITSPIYIIITVILGCFGLFSVHETALLETEEKFKYRYEQNPYRISGIMPDNAGVISDEDFGGYATADIPKPSYQAVNGNTKVRLKGIEVEHSDLELINKYIKGNLKDLAVQQLGQVTGLNIQDCREIIDEWDRYYY